jgi:superfamily II DNA or RNA helicase
MSNDLIPATPAPRPKLGDRTLPWVHEFLQRHPRIETRPYQLRIIAKNLDAWTTDNPKHQHAHINTEAPVGSGKTAMALVANAIMQEKGYVDVSTWSAMRRNLLKQVHDEAAQYQINLRLITISMFDNDPPYDQIQGQRVLHTDDESHHQAAASAVSLREGLQKRVTRLYTSGLSGTPWRSDGHKLAYSLVIRDASARQLIQDGYLSQFHYYHLPKWTPKNAIKLYTSDVDRWGRSIMFFHTVESVLKVVRGLKKAGIAAAQVEPDQYKRIDQLAEFKDGKYQVLVGCLTLTEGFNDPDLKTVFLRDSNKGVTIQMGGRALRKSRTHPFKQIVQAEKGWCFTKYATPANQFLLRDNHWIDIAPNENVDKVGTRMVKYIADRIAHDDIDKELQQQLFERKKSKHARKF